MDTKVDPKFLNRKEELAALNALLKKNGLGVVIGRRRIGKSRLIRKFCQHHNGAYAQAIEGTPSVQIEQIWKDLGVPTETIPQTWNSFFEMLALQVKLGKIKVLAIDEFPWLVESDQSLPSIMQKWWDQSFENSKITLILAGSSQRMMHANFLDGSAPLYGRANLILQIKPMEFYEYLKMFNFDPTPTSFETFSIMGGIPRYWILSEGIADPITAAEHLFFNSTAILSDEPLRLLWDEGFSGQTPRFILELVGRGNHKPSEIASRLGVTQGSLSRPISQLIDAGLLTRENPFGESHHTSKKVLLKITDPTLRFWFSVYSPLRTRWSILTKEEKQKIIHNHASIIWEEYWRTRLKGVRYWEKNLEIDCIVQAESSSALVAEIKWAKLRKQDKNLILEDLKRKWAGAVISTKFKKVDFKIIDQTDLT